MKRTRIVISGDEDTLKDALELAEWCSLGAKPNVSDALRRLLRWAITHQKEATVALGIPLGRPKERTSEPRQTTVQDALQKIPNTNPPIVFEPAPVYDPKNDPDGWGEPPA